MTSYNGNSQSSKRTLVILVALLGLLLAACQGLPESGGGGGDDCTPADLVAPEHSTPATDYEIILDLDYFFVWSYGGCEPDGWQVQLVPHDPQTYNQFPPADTVVGTPLPAQTSWVFDGVLQPASAYEWRVAAEVDGELGPYSATTIFWTGPICGNDELAVPTQLSPADESVINTPEGPFFWSLGGDCVPEYVFFELGSTPGFPGANLGTGLGAPRLISYPSQPLDNCEEFFWRVRSESAEAASDWSPVWSFNTDFEGDCAGQGSGSPMGVASRDLNCREGDGQAFNESGFMAAGESAEILGRNGDGSWYLVPLALGGGDCWVAALYVDLEPDADLDLIAEIPSPPTPQPPLANPYAVTEVQVSVDMDFYRGACPVQFTFTAEITSSGPGIVEYRWLRSDGATAQVEQIEFSQAGTIAVVSTWDLSSGVHEGLWKQIEILHPNGLLSNQAVFDVYCSS